MPASNAQTVRRSSRVPVKVPIRVTSMEPNAQFSEICETLVVSAHGCALRFPLKLDAGSALRLHSRGGRQATAYVVFCQPMGPDGQGFRLGAQLDRPENFWGLESCPDDWRVVEMPAPAAQQPPQQLSAKSAVLHQPQTPSRASRDVLDKLEEQLSEDRLRDMLAKLVQPLQAEVTELREKLAVNAKRNRFEVSLGYIPPELEEKLWERLRQDLGTRVLQQTREQSSEILGSAKTAIEQKISAALTEFRHRLSGELHAVDQRAQVLSKELTTAAQQHVRAGIEKLQRQALETGAHLNAQGEKLLCSLQGQLADSHEVHRREIEQIQADAAAKASQLQSEVSDLGRRMAPLNESVRRLESDLDAHLESVAGEIVSDARTQLENAVALTLKDLQARGSNEVETKLNEICGHLRTIQNRIEGSFSGSLKAQGEEAVQSIAQQFEEIAQQSLEKWRLALAKDLNSVAKTLGQQLREELEPEAGQS
ncbi:MAG TPA: PilZ domain-containing protein [Terriglobales bacterium]|nr:PilZ domain-containing protein [Terriglobales bacterium]